MYPERYTSDTFSMSDIFVQKEQDPSQEFQSMRASFFFGHVDRYIPHAHFLVFKMGLQFHPDFFYLKMFESFFEKQEKQRKENEKKMRTITTYAVKRKFYGLANA